MVNKRSLHNHHLSSSSLVWEIQGPTECPEKGCHVISGWTSYTPRETQPTVLLPCQSQAVELAQKGEPFGGDEAVDKAES